MTSPDPQDFFETIVSRLASRLKPRRPVFITGRFRSGTTALWNIFRQEPSVLAIYEPLHDNLPEYLAHELPTDASHRGVTDYFRELRQHRELVLQHYRREFGASRLTLAAGDEHPELRAYLDSLIGLAGSRRPLLKFVRMDFRLAWLRRQYPEAVIIHIHRHPREQWLSMLAKETPEFAAGRRVNIFQLSLFAASLVGSLPEILSPAAESSYERAYYLARISRAVGEKYADLTIDFEHEFLARDAKMFSRLTALTGIPVLRRTLNQFLATDIPPHAAPAENAVDFAAIEQRCDAVLERRGLLRAIAAGALERAWPTTDVAPEIVAEAVESLGLACAREQSRAITAHSELREAREVLRQALHRVEVLQARVEQAEAAAAPALRAVGTPAFSAAK